MQDRRSPLVKIFRANLWKAIHKEVLDVLQKILEEKLGPFVLVDSDDGTKFLLSDGRWPMSKPSLLAESKDIFDQKGDEYWICLRLRWGAYDSHDIEHYTREKFMDYTLNSTGELVRYFLTSVFYAMLSNSKNIFCRGRHWARPNLQLLFSIWKLGRRSEAVDFPCNDHYPEGEISLHITLLLKEKA